MKIDMLQTVRGYDTEFLSDQSGAPWTLRRICCQALITQNPEDGKPEAQCAQFALAERLHREDDPDISVQELATLQKLISRAFLPAVVGPTWRLLDGKHESETE